MPNLALARPGGLVRSCTSRQASAGGAARRLGRKPRAYTRCLGHHGAMERLERVVVQLVEAKRMAQYRDDAHGRLALLLLDNIVETLFYRQTSYLLSLEDFERRTVAGLEGRQDLPDDLAKMRDETLANLTSKNQRKKIDREFDAKADYLVHHELVEATDARVLKKLHQYRNEAYHRDQVRQSTLETAVGIYFWLACHLFAALPVHSIVYGHVPKGLEQFLSPGRSKRVSSDFPKDVAQQLLADYRLTDEDVSDLLSEHLLSRLAEIRDNLNYVADNSLSGRDTSAAEFLHIIQIENDLGFGWLKPEVIRAQPVKYEMKDLDRWERRSCNIAKTRPMLKAFTEFANIEDEFEGLEHRVTDRVIALDDAINLEIDRLRGK